MLINIFRINYLINIHFCHFRSALISAAPNSAIALHSIGRNPEGLSSNKNDTILVEPFVFDIHRILLSLNMYGVLNLGDCCQIIYDSKIKLKDSPINIRTKSLIDKSYWHQIRQFKITGSRCYSLFTYYTASKKTDAQWALKASKYFWPNTFSNKFVKHGIKYESVAIELFARDSKQNIVPCGFVTSYDYPWLGYSPDGIIVNNFNEPTKLVEIKCPYLGSTVGLQDVIEKVKFISKNADGSLTLNKKDAYYAQVQLGLILLNLSSCDFVVYNSLEHNYIVINVEFDFNYCKTLLQVLKIVFFEKLLHSICEFKI